MSIVCQTARTCQNNKIRIRSDSEIISQNGRDKAGESVQCCKNLDQGSKSSIKQDERSGKKIGSKLNVYL